MKCLYCEGEVPQERIDIGKEYCMSPDCVSKGVAQAMSGYRLVLMPKQGFTYVHADSDELKYGRSSGR